MISIVVTTYKESRTLAQAIQAILNQNLLEEYEILIVGPDQETEKIANQFIKGSSKVKYLRDEGRGKPAALNLAFREARGDIIVLTDGDVRIGEGSLNYLLEPFKNSTVGATSGRPISINSRNNLFGYWSHFLTSAAHRMRYAKSSSSSFGYRQSEQAHADSWPCSGYLFAIRGRLVKRIPEDVFAEDAVITQMVRNQGYQVVYVPEAKVYVKYPDNFKDWLKQKIRTVGGYIQKESGEGRNLWQEISDGIKLFFTYPKNLKEFWWTILLCLTRIYLWLLIFWNIKIKNKNFAAIWQRVESTK